MNDPIQTRDELIRSVCAIEKEVRGLCVHRLGLFGSFARDSANSESDVDLLVEFTPGQKSFDRFNELCDLWRSVWAGAWSWSPRMR